MAFLMALQSHQHVCRFPAHIKLQPALLPDGVAHACFEYPSGTASLKTCLPSLHAWGMADTNALNCSHQLCAHAAVPRGV